MVIVSEREIELARQIRNAYKRDWRARNREKVKAQNERYWAKKAREAIENEQEKSV